MIILLALLVSLQNVVFCWPKEEIPDRVKVDIRIMEYSNPLLLQGNEKIEFGFSFLTKSHGKIDKKLYGDFGETVNGTQLLPTSPLFFEVVPRLVKVHSIEWKPLDMFNVNIEEDYLNLQFPTIYNKTIFSNLTLNGLSNQSTITIQLSVSCIDSRLVGADCDIFCHPSRNNKTAVCSSLTLQSYLICEYIDENKEEQVTACQVCKYGLKDFKSCHINMRSAVISGIFEFTIFIVLPFVVIAVIVGLCFLFARWLKATKKP